MDLHVEHLLGLRNHTLTHFIGQILLIEQYFELELASVLFMVPPCTTFDIHTQMSLKGHSGEVRRRGFAQAIASERRPFA